MDHMYQLVFFLLTYLIPLVGMSITYIYLGRVLWRMQWKSNFSVEDDRKKLRIKKEMRKVGR
jgi:hypothetical protein